MNETPITTIYRHKRHLLFAIDPVHVGTGGYRLGRVDLTIAREPGTNLPKIPGTSLSGAIRSYAAMQYNKIRCAGQGQTISHCGSDSCPICYTFGFAKGADNGSAGTVSISDAHILFFPVYSMDGPVWVSTSVRLLEAGFNCNDKIPTAETATTSLNDWSEPFLNLGWLLLPMENGLDVAPSGYTFDSESQSLWDSLKDRIVLVTEKLFSQIINSNLEVRTSVSINQKTGAAEDRGLYTYEAIPRGSWLFFDAIEDDYRRNPDNTSMFPETTKKCKIEVEDEKEIEKDNEGEGLPQKWGQPFDVLESGLELLQYLGVGGMGTRGFGRVRRAGFWKITNGGV